MPENVNRNNIELPSEVSSEILEKTQDESAIMKLAKSITLPGHGLTIPVITGDPTAAWVGETDPKPVSTANLGKKVMQAYKLAVIEPFSNEFKRDAGALYDALVKRLPAALGTAFDQTCLGAMEKPGDNFDTFASCTAQSILPGSTGADTYKGLVAADADISTAGGLLNGFALGAQARGLLLSAVDNDGRPLFTNSAADGAPSRILGAPIYFNRGLYKAGSAEAPAIVGIAGDWTKALYGTVEGVQVKISDQATLTYKDAEGQTHTINLWQQNMFAVMAEIEVGFRADLNAFNLLTGKKAA